MGDVMDKMVAINRWYILSALAGMWLIALIIVIVATTTDPSSVELSASVYMVMFSLMLAVFGYLMSINSKVAVLAERFDTIEDAVNKVTELGFRKK